MLALDGCGGSAKGEGKGERTRLGEKEKEKDEEAISLTTYALVDANITPSCLFY